MLIALKIFLLSKSESAKLSERLASAWPHTNLPKVKNIKVYEIEPGKRLLSADTMIAAEVGDIIVPFLGKQDNLQHFPSVTIDSGAVKFVCNGAKVMRPGIVNFGTFNKGEIVRVREQTRGRSLAVGVAMEHSETAKAMSKGYIIDTVHYVSDKIWEAYKRI